MAGSFAAIWSQLGDAASATAIIALAVGGLLTLFKPWIPAEEDVRKRVALHKQALIEKFTIDFTRLLELTRDLDVPVRSAAPQEDLPGLCSRNLFRCAEDCAGLSSIRRSVGEMHSLLLWLTILALVLLLGSLSRGDARPYLALACILLIFFEVAVVIRLRKLSAALEQYERSG